MKKECIAFNIVFVTVVARAFKKAFEKAFGSAINGAIKFAFFAIVILAVSPSCAYASKYNLLDIGTDIIRSKLLLKPYVTVGYHSSIPINVSQTCDKAGTSVNCSSFMEHERQRFFEDIASFKNFQLGVGLRINQYFGFEVSYDSFQKEASIVYNGAYITSSMLASGQWVNVMLMMYSPPIDVKIGTLEFSLGAGMAIPFAFKGGVTQQSDGSIPSYITSQKTMGSTPSFSAMAGVTFGLKQPISFTLYTQFLSFNQSASSSYTYGTAPDTSVANYAISSPFMMTAGIKVNIFVL